MKNGDLLFIRHNQNELSQTIVKSSLSSHSFQYDHVAIIIYNHKEPYVYEACPEFGVHKTSFKQFIKDTNNNIDVYRLKTTFNVQKLFLKAEKCLGLPYNYSFNPNNHGFYCANFIYEIFEHQYFHLIHMKFGPNQQIEEYWLKYYQKINQPIPINELGLNPNAMIEQGVLKLIELNINHKTND
ncbi:hypothetical protein LNP07_00140 [Apilactobacillus sp. M161]|uniref:Permuted papain-like amidase enzyme, YaeF/YiiX, C92 family n=1 Tax=Apilactobacillus xinyiensis TaxID=2841032 RepID=A0ABT0HZC0_9LACO|nr:YiiX/YebB-like N1pC/P60 family cysteine hydrolase [Apilactobacillus xinyiensis]MCK8623933.1 hypothetical protein [Apilactobacillus xinyiensis]